MAHFHQEPYLVLAGLTHERALVAWGSFFFKVSGQLVDGRFKLIEDSDLSAINPPRQSTIGESSSWYGPARVLIKRKGVAEAAREFTVSGQTPATRVNHAWLEGLEPQTTYEYQVFVNNEPWAEFERRDWVFRNNQQGMFLNGKRYVNEFTTYPRPEATTPNFAFAVIGDHGWGVRKPSDAERRQREIAEALEVAVQTKGVRFVLTTGDHIYGKRDLFGLHDSGNEDSDWFFTHYQPYRYILNQTPFYPACGNHDTSETEHSDDYDQMLDNFYIRERFLSSSRDEGEAVKEKGLFYHFRFGRDCEFISIDSARPDSNPSTPRAFQQPLNQQTLAQWLPPVTGAPAVWRIPFFHHPPYVDGPTKNNDPAAQQHLVTRFFEPGGVRLVFNGHEHNFQVARHNKIHYVLSGAAGDLRAGALRGESAAHNIAWAPKHHFLLVEYRNGAMHITPYGELQNGQLTPVQVTPMNGSGVASPLKVSLV